MKRMPELDALRGIAATIIVIYHMWIPAFALAGTAVDLFFVMSGYLISTIILDQRRDPHFLRTFYIRRSLRIWPIYYLAILVTALVSIVLPPIVSAQALPYYLTYTQNLQHYWFGEAPVFFDGLKHTWTLAIEEQFYMLWPLMLMVGGRKALVPLSVTFTISAIVARSFGFGNWILLTRSDGLAMGGLLAALLSHGVDGFTAIKKPARFLVAAAIAALGFRAVGTLKPFGMGEPWGLSLRMYAMNLVYFTLIGAVVLRSGSPFLAPLRHRSLVYLGKLSYGIYLYHYIVLHFVDRLGWTNRIAIDGLKVGLSFGLAALSWQYVEQPVLRLKDRFDYGRKTAKAAPTRVNSPAPLPATA